jgi:endonuclease V-like protein UPF0215 family
LTSLRPEKLKVFAVEDGPFCKGDGGCVLVGAMTCGTTVDQVVMDQILVDGTDATQKIAAFVDQLKWLDLIMLPSISLGGFNVVDPFALHSRSKRPVLIANPARPHLDAVRKALKVHFPDWEKRYRVFELMGSPATLRIGSKDRIYFYRVGLSSTRAVEILRCLVRLGKTPEPLRIAKLFARGLRDSSSMKSPRRVSHKCGH